jgi:peroxiredoxin Q/BCP
MATGSETAIEIGQRAPQFTLPNQDGEKVKLTDYKGRWVVLYFYPKDDTPGSTTEACDFTAGLDEFRDMDAEVLGCSPDAPESHRKFADKHGLQVTLLSDPDHKVMEKYGAWGEKKMYGKAREGVIRSTVLINPSGKIAHHWPNVRAKGHAEKVKQKLAELQEA